MKRLFIFSALLFFMLAIPLRAFAGEFEVGFEWDANTEDIVIGYRLWVSDQAGGPYEPVKDIEGRETTEVCHEFQAPDGVETIKYFVVTAYCSNDMESGYSNEVNFTFDFRVIEAAYELAAVLQGDDIVFTWKQESIDRVKLWYLYRSESDGGPYETFLIIKYTGEAGPQYSSTVNMPVPVGEKKTYYFVLVTTTDQNVTSVDSNQVAITIDKTVPAPVYNFRLKVQAE